MAESDRRHTPLAADLPPLYQRDRASFDQIAGYLGLVDDLQLAHLERLDELASWLSPHALDLWPPGVPLDAGHDDVLAAYCEVFDELARWFSYIFPGTWAGRDGGLEKKRRFLQRAARFWRRRATPRGFVDWVSFAFDIDDAHRPLLLEHFKYGPPRDSAGDVGPPPGLRATLLVRSAEQFRRFARRREFVEFVAATAPSHVLMRVCWIEVQYDLPDPPPSPLTDKALNAYRDKIRAVLCDLGDDVPHGLGVVAPPCANEGDPKDQLGIARLPSTGTAVNHTRPPGGTPP